MTLALRKEIRNINLCLMVLLTRFFGFLCILAIMLPSNEYPRLKFLLISIYVADKLS